MADTRKEKKAKREKAPKKTKKDDEEDMEVEELKPVEDWSKYTAIKQTVALAQCPAQSVTVYSDRAEVSRMLSVDLAQKGLHEIIVTGFLGDEDTFRVSRGVGNVTLLEFSYSVVPEVVVVVDETAVKTAEEKLKLQIKQINRSIQELDIKLTHVNEEKSWLAEYAKQINHATSHTVQLISKPMDFENAQNFMKFYASNLQRLDDELSKLNAQKEALVKQRTDLDNSRSTTKTQEKKEIRQFSISLAANDATHVTLQLSYVITDASWVPRYDVRVDSVNDECVLTYLGVITNDTGEDWKDVMIALSTAAPSMGGEPPKLYPLKLDFEENVPQTRLPSSSASPRSFSRKLSIARMDTEEHTKQKPKIDDHKEEKMKKPPLDMTSTVQNQGTSATYHIERKSTIASDKKPRKVTIAKANIDTVMEYVVVPSKSDHAYLKAKAKNTSMYQLLEGDMNVFMDGVFVTNSKLLRTNPGEEFQLYLGIDNGVRVEVKPTNKQDEQQGILWKRTMTKTAKFVTVVRNNKKKEIRVLVFDQLPFASDKSITVKVKEPADPSEYTVSEESILKRVFTLNPSEEKRLRLVYVIEFPSDKTLYFVPQPAGNINY